MILTTSLYFDYIALLLILPAVPSFLATQLTGVLGTDRSLLSYRRVGRLDMQPYSVADVAGCQCSHQGFSNMKVTDTEPAWDDQAKLLRVMAHPMRLMILTALCERPQCVRDLNSLIPIVQAHLSQHMAALRKAGLVDCHVCGPLRCYYIIRPTFVKKLLQLLSTDHPPQLRSRDAVVRASKQTQPSQAKRR
ncbi:MAG: winged helix-turn-helix transcriptional regulator [Pirellulales bacterium]|nr:winged helix-turn-helix transcriptional regulator [Pirellulales bacterium]